MAVSPNPSGSNSRLSIVYQVAFVCAALILVTLLIQSCMNRSLSRNELLSAFIASTAIGLIFFAITNIDVSELALGSFKIKINSKLKQIENILLTNKAVKVKQTGKYYWIDEEGIAHEGERKVVLFLSSDKTTSVVEEEFIAVRNGKPLPEWREAKAITSNDTDVFILFDGKLYYQSNLSALYDLAQLSKDNLENLAEKFEKWQWKDNRKEKRFVEKKDISDCVFEKIVMR